MEKKTGLIFYRGKIATLDYFSEELYNSARERGIASLLLNAGDEHTANEEIINNFSHTHRCTAILFNNVMLGPVTDGETVWSRCQIPVYNILVDHPVNYLSSLTYPVGEHHIVVIDRAHERFIRFNYPEMKHLHFLPLGGTEEAGWLPFEERDIDVLYVGSCQPDIEFETIEELSDGGEDFYIRVVQNLLQNPSLTTEEAIRLWAVQTGIRAGKETLLYLHEKYGFRCEIYVRRYFKQEIMKGLSESGVAVDVYGTNWENPDYSYGDGIRFHSLITPRECGVMSGRAKICLNIMPWFKDGSHDRIHSGMLNGAVVMTDSSSYLDERFRHGKDIVFYDMSDVPGLVYNLRWLLEHPDVAGRIALAGRQVAATEDTWERRLDTILGWEGL